MVSHRRILPPLQYLNYHCGFNNGNTFNGKIKELTVSPTHCPSAQVQITFQKLLFRYMCTVLTESILNTAYYECSQIVPMYSRFQLLAMDMNYLMQHMTKLKSEVIY